APVLRVSARSCPNRCGSARPNPPGRQGLRGALRATPSRGDDPCWCSTEFQRQRSPNGPVGVLQARLEGVGGVLDDGWFYTGCSSGRYPQPGGAAYPPLLPI